QRCKPSRRLGDRERTRVMFAVNDASLRSSATAPHRSSGSPTGTTSVIWRESPLVDEGIYAPPYGRHRNPSDQSGTVVGRTHCFSPAAMEYGCRAKFVTVRSNFFGQGYNWEEIPIPTVKHPCPGTQHPGLDRRCYGGSWM